MRKGEITKKNIIENAIKLFSVSGYDATSVQSIADASGISQAAVFQHFKNKKELLNALRTHITMSVVDFVQSRMKPEMSAKERLFIYLHGNLDWALKNREMSQVIFLNYYMACFDDELFHTHIKKVLEIAEDRVTELTLACQREGDLSKKKDAQVVAKHIHDYLIGLSIKLLSSSRARSMTKTVKERSDNFLNEILS